MGTTFTSCSTDPVDEEFPVEGTVGNEGNDPEEEDPDS